MADSINTKKCAVLFIVYILEVVHPRCV